MPNLLEQQAFHNYFRLLGKLIIDWVDLKPKNKQLRHVLKCVNEIGVFTHTLITERDILKLKIDKLNKERLELLKEIDRLKEYEL